ncbi:MAG: ATP-binding protein [Candidatus Riflebacteria bacterium]|nr:ATP-binding protein [Candidatus Riflebacteria bacterium]
MIQDVLQHLPKSPKDPQDLGRTLDTLEELLLKSLYLTGEMSGNQLSKSLKISVPIINKVLKLLADEELLTVVGAATKSGIDLGGDFTYALYAKGIEKAKNVLDRNQYLGVAPVTFEEYQNVTREYMKATATNPEFRVTPEKVKEVFSRRIGYQELNHVIGQAAASRQSIFLYGGAGNGKTDLSFQIVHLLPPILLPYAVEVNKQILKVFDESIQTPLAEYQTLRGYDPRWQVCQAPMVTVGGEMVLSDLDVKYDDKFKAFRPPPQVLANGGVFLIDDFGRQQCRTDEIFNRLIVPLENHIDFMVVAGSRLTVMTDEVIIFSSNLSLKDIMDPAFLRRIPYKVVMRDPTMDEYAAIWNLVLGRMNLKDKPDVLPYLLSKYSGDQRPFKASQPRDLLRLVRNKLYYYNAMERPISREDIDEAYATYFPKDIVY